VDYFTNVYTIETWAVGTEHGQTVSGHPAPTATKGGYFESTFGAVGVPTYAVTITRHGEVAEWTKAAPC
jgi:hypothetical protein